MAGETGRFRFESRKARGGKDFLYFDIVRQRPADGAFARRKLPRIGIADVFDFVKQQLPGGIEGVLQDEDVGRRAVDGTVVLPDGMEDDIGVERIEMVPMTQPVGCPLVDFDVASDEFSVDDERGVTEVRPGGDIPVALMDDLQRRSVAARQSVKQISFIPKDLEKMFAEGCVVCVPCGRRFMDGEIAVR